MRPEARRVGPSWRAATIQHRIAKWQTGSQEAVKLLGAGISAKERRGRKRMKEMV